MHFTRRFVFDRLSAHCPTPRRVYPRALLTAAHSRLRRSWPHLIPNRCSNRRRVPNRSRRVRTTIPFPSATGVRRWPRPLNVRWDRFGPTSGDHWCYTCGYSCSLVGRCFAMLLRVQSATASICGGSPSHRAGFSHPEWVIISRNDDLLPKQIGSHRQFSSRQTSPQERCARNAVCRSLTGTCTGNREAPTA